MFLKNILILSVLLCTAPSVLSNIRFVDSVFSEVNITDGIEYRTAANYAGTDVSLKMDIYQPKGDPMSSRPAVLVIHGGAFAEGVGGRADEFSASTAQYLAKKGYITASIDYRTGYAISPTKAASEVNKAAYRAIQDAKAAVRFLKANADLYKIDTSAIFLCGYSAGAIIALNYSHLTVDKFLTHEDTAGIGDLETGKKLSFSSSVSGLIGFAGAVLDTSWISAGAAPSICFHGTADEIVPYQSGYAFGIQIMPYLYGSSSINRVSGRIGYTNKLITYEGETHNFVNSTPLLRSSLDSAAIFISSIFGPNSVRSPYLKHNQLSDLKAERIELIDLSGRVLRSQNKVSGNLIIKHDRSINKASKAALMLKR